MGGLGSGDWYRRGKKATVEESLTLSIGDFRGRLFPQSDGIFTWSWESGRQSRIGYSVSWDNVSPIVTLQYRWDDREDVRIPVRVQSTPTHFSGCRRWFTCPLIVDGVACNRRVAKLHLPPSSPYFGCRNCHELTYRSSQEAHQAERAAAFFDAHGPRWEVMLARLRRRERSSTRRKA